MKRYRLLNPSIYASPVGEFDENGMRSDGFYNPFDDMSRYPVVVDAEQVTYLPDYIRVSGSELDRAFPYKSGNGRGEFFNLAWTNKPMIESRFEKSWEEVTPFDYWNKLKESREVGSRVPRGYL